MQHLVIDSSALSAWLLPDEHLPALAPIMIDIAAGAVTASVPILAHWDVRNAIVSARRSNRIDDDRVAGMLQVLSELPLDVDAAPNEHRLGQVVRLALTHGLTAHDAVYLELVLRLNIPLLSLDKAMIRAAKACGIACLDVTPSVL